MPAVTRGVRRLYGGRETQGRKGSELSSDELAKWFFFAQRRAKEGEGLAYAYVARQLLKLAPPKSKKLRAELALAGGLVVRQGADLRSISRKEKAALALWDAAQRDAQGVPGAQRLLMHARNEPITDADRFLADD